MYHATDLSYKSAPASASNDCALRVDFKEAGAGPLAVLVHSSTAGAHQWSALIHDLEQHLLVRAINLFGYGSTPPWSDAKPPVLNDFAELVALAVPDTASDICLVGHSFGGAVAMHAAANQLKGRVKGLVLIEPSLFYLLDRRDRPEAFAELSALARYTKQCIGNHCPEAAAEAFIDHWCGPGTWAATSAKRKSSFAKLMTLLPHEWDALLEGTTTLNEWTAALPRNTLVMSFAKTTRPSRELVEMLSDACPHWAFATIWDGGHMAPLTHPQLVNPIIRGFLTCDVEMTGLDDTPVAVAGLLVRETAQRQPVPVDVRSRISAPGPAPTDEMPYARAARQIALAADHP